MKTIATIIGKFPVEKDTYANINLLKIIFKPVKSKIVKVVCR